MSGHYLLDTNIFIQAKNLYYAFDIAPTFWRKLNQLAQNNRFSIIDHVKRELTKSRENPDDIHIWIMDTYSGEILSTNDLSVLEKYREITERIVEDNNKGFNKYNQDAIDTFLYYYNADA